MAHTKASGPATDSVNEPLASDHASDRRENTQNLKKTQARPRDPRRLKGEADGESSIYVGGDLAGTISWLGGTCTAFDSDENLLGVFVNSRAAARAITAARR
jgi:hypothetical protein